MPRSQRTSFVVLGMLALSGRRARSGYEIRKGLGEVVSFFWHEGNAQIYPALERLAASGLIEAKADSKKGRRKKLYAITPKGRRQLRDWLAAPVETGKPRDELILKLFFGTEAEVPGLMRHVGEHGRRAQAALDWCTQRLRHAPPGAAERNPFQWITLRAGLARSEAEVRWAEDALKILGGLGQTRGRA